MPTVAFLGSHPLGERCLRLLADHSDIDVEVVVTYPADHDGWWKGSVHELATELGYPTFTLHEEHELLEYPVEYLVSVYYPNILDEELLAHPAELPVNLHQAELPRYRGSNVFSHAIMNARADDHWRHGTTLHVMAPAVDAGDVLDRGFVPIAEDDTARSLYERVRERSIDLFATNLRALAHGTLEEQRTPQSAFDGERYYHAKDSLDDLKEIPAAALSESDRERAVYDRIRALDFPPHEPAWTRLDGEKVYLTTEGYQRFD